MLEGRIKPDGGGIGKDKVGSHLTENGGDMAKDRVFTG